MKQEISFDAASLFSKIKNRESKERKPATGRLLLLKVNDFLSGCTLMLLRKIFMFGSTGYAFLNLDLHLGKRKSMKMPDKQLEK